jgi:hypothetical protein
MENPFFTGLNEGLKQVVPLAMRKWEIDQANEKWNQQLQETKRAHTLTMATQLAPTNPEAAQMILEREFPNIKITESATNQLQTAKAKQAMREIAAMGEYDKFARTPIAGVPELLHGGADLGTDLQQKFQATKRMPNLAEKIAVYGGLFPKEGLNLGVRESAVESREKMAKLLGDQRFEGILAQIAGANSRADKGYDARIAAIEAQSERADKTLEGKKTSAENNDLSKSSAKVVDLLKGKLVKDEAELRLLKASLGDEPIYDYRDKYKKKKFEIADYENDIKQTKDQLKEILGDWELPNANTAPASKPVNAGTKKPMADITTFDRKR